MKMTLIRSNGSRLSHVFNRALTVLALTVGLALTTQAALDGVPTVMPNFGEDVEVFWARHPYNPESPNYDPEIDYPTPIINVADYGNSISTAIGALPSNGGTIILNNGGSYSFPDITARSNLYFVCTNGMATATMGGYIAGCAEAKSYHNHADCANAFDPDCIDCLVEKRAQNILFKNLNLPDSGGDGWRIVSARNIVFWNCNFYGDLSESSMSSQYANYWTHFVARQWADNIWAVNCSFTGWRKYHLYCDGVHNLGIVNCFFDDTTDSGAGIFFANDDFSVDVNQNGLVEPGEARQIKYHIFYGNTFEAKSSWTHCILLQGQHNLVKSNTVIGTPRSFVEFKSRFSYLHPYHVYEAVGNKVIGNVTEGCSVEWIQMNHLNFEPDGNRDVQCPYAADGIMGRYTVKCNQINGPVPVFINEAGLAQIGPNLVTNNCINDPGCVPCDGAPPSDLTLPGVPTGLTIEQESDTFIALAWQAASDNVGVAGYNVYRDGIRKGVATTTNFIDYTLTPGTAYAYSLKAFDEAGNLTDFSASITGTTKSASGGPVPAPWTCTKIGNGLGGSASHADGLFSIAGSGSDIAGTGDSLYYMHQTVTGNFVLTARMINQERTDAYAKAGLMLRNDVNSASPHVFNLMTPAYGGRCQVRATEAGNSDRVTEYPSYGPPCWFRMERDGDDFHLSSSHDGRSWSLEYTTNGLVLSNTACVGLAVCAHDVADLSLCQFDNVQLALPNTVELPSLLPTDGYTRSAVTVSLACATSGADIRYTTDGSDPDEGAALYATPLILTNNATLKARAYKTGMTPSAIAKGRYVFYATVPPPEQHGLWIEAEWGVITPPYVVGNTDTNSSGDAYLTFLENKNTGSKTAGDVNAARSVYGFTIATAGSHRVWCRVKGPSNQDDSFYIRVDGGSHTLWDITETGTWTWEQLFTPTLSAGDHTLEISEREDGVKIDCIFIAWDVSNTPTGQTPTIWATGDQDGDDIPDTWERAAFGNTSLAGAGTDSDGDGASDLHEYRAGTQPTNLNSVLAVEQVDPVAPLDNQNIIRWQTVPGRSYTLQRADSMTSFFANVVSGVQASNWLHTTTVTVENAQEYYRVRLGP